MLQQIRYNKQPQAYATADTIQETTTAYATADTVQ